MTNFTKQIASYVFVLALLISALPQRVFAQVVKQASSIADRDLGCVAVVVCGSIVDSGNAIDNNPATAASISPPLAIGTAALRLGFSAPIPAGAQVSMMVSFTGSALSAGLVNNTKISTFTSGGAQARQTVGMNSALNLTTLNTSVMSVSFMATDRFQELELRTGSLLAANVGYAVQLYHATATYMPLPVELKTFAGAAQGSKVTLNWSTASEKNSDYYRVERATANAPEQFQAIGQVAAAGSSTMALDYAFVDAQPLEMNYYRLKQVDKDGTSTYSSVVAVRTTPALTLQAYPNPTNGRLTITGAKDTRFALVSQLGRVVQQGSLAASQSCELDFSSQPDGMYFLRNQATGATVKVAKNTAGKGL
jgi:hypothetical protein